MSQGEVGHLIAQICITVLIVAASLIPIIAGFSALKKWKEAREAQQVFDERDRAFRFLQKKHGEEQRAFYAQSEQTPDALEQMQARQSEEMRAAGIPRKTMGDFDRELLLGERPSEGFQAPTEVAWAILALLCAAAAGIWDLWL